jgi:DNA (cytosine-5)-methyltransferase 1
VNELALFAGAGGGILGGILLGWRTVCAVEIDPYARDVLLARQRDAIFDPFPVWDDIRTFDGSPWRGHVDVISGGFPCQDISAAGKGAGIDGERSGLWGQMARIVGEVRPRYVFVENSPLLVGRGLVRVLADLAEMGFDARWGIVGACEVGAPHRRNRCWIVGNAMRHGRQSRRNDHAKHDRQEFAADGKYPDAMAHSDSKPRNERRVGYTAQESEWWQFDRCGESADFGHAHGAGLAEWKGQPIHDGEELAASVGAGLWSVEPDVGRVVNGVASRVDRLRCIGNGQVPGVAALAWHLLSHDPPPQP